MSNLYGRLNSDTRKKEVTSCGRKYIFATLETWHEKITVSLTDDGRFDVERCSKDGQKRRTIKKGKLKT